MTRNSWWLRLASRAVLVGGFIALQGCKGRAVGGAATGVLSTSSQAEGAVAVVTSSATTQLDEDVAPPLEAAAADCAWPDVSAKAAEDPYFIEEWKAAEARNWSQPPSRLTEKVAVSLVPGAKAEAVARAFGAKIIERITPTDDTEVFVFKFPTVEAATNAMKPLLCSPLVRWAAITRRY